MRTVLLLGASIVMARLLTPEDFGLASLANSVAIFLGGFTGGLPFEEALAQRRVLRRAHLDTALGVSCLGTLGLMVAIAITGFLVGPLFGAADFWLLLAASFLPTLAQAFTTTHTAVARRRRDFGLIARSNSVGAFASAVSGILAAYLGAGAWAIVIMRIMLLVGNASVFLGPSRPRIVPRVSLPHLADIWQYSALVLVQRVAMNSVYPVINYTVATFFSVAAVGAFNMALRLTDPLRGLVRSISHTTTFELMREKTQARGDFADRFRMILTIVTLLVAPAFLGIAAVAELMLSVLVGEKWLSSAPIMQALAVGSSIVLPLDLIAIALNARGVPSHLVGQRLLGLGALMVSLAVAVANNLAGLGAGIAWMVADATEGAWAVRASRRLGLVPWRVLLTFAFPWSLAAAMALVVHSLQPVLTARMPQFAALPAAAACGAVLYAVLVLSLVPPSRQWLKSLVSR